MSHRPVEITPSNLDFREYNRETLITNTQQQSCLCTTGTLGSSLFYTLELNTRLLPHHPPPAGPTHYRAQVRALGTHQLNRGAQYSHPTLCWTQTSTANHARFMQCTVFSLLTAYKPQNYCGKWQQQKNGASFIVRATARFLGQRWYWYSPVSVHAGKNSSKQCWHACIYQARTCLIPCQSNTKAALVFKSSSVIPEGCSPRSHHCVMGCLGKSDSWSLMTPQTPRGWSSPAVSSMVASGNMCWGQAQNIWGYSSRGEQAPSPEVLQGVPLPSWNGEPQPLQVSAVLRASGNPQNPPGKEWLWIKPELATPQSPAQNKPTPALSAALLER